ncbi:mannitol-1-phosphate 5-dehydrogenase [Sebaldella sp. S0638]|uniref:mannitol-1-phosphate 5-dehydrogenase n=1 Tax=Sebaldella sp. S0638 TaxID=2957809 RepID=UPI00209EB097|nr:mannitol-1-phosphate 5-dehydrogenase [Sebaldella sp. S0638]MCP1225635.1 mannitol-1-phosphate 5-dehydrogenase [Sebaldella sp. S0638]
MNAVHFGAGNIGRGFIGCLLSESDFEVCFVDVNSDVVNRLNDDKYYMMKILDGVENIRKISPVTALNSLTQEEEIIKKITEADIITTSTGVNNLPRIAPLLTKGLLKRAGMKKDRIDIIANENAINASSILKKEILNLVSAEEAGIIEENTGFPNSAIDRQALSENFDGIDIAVVEPYYEWVINKSEILSGKTLKIKGAVYVEYMKPYIERKLYCVNAGHATAAYAGFAAGCKTVQEALAREEIQDFVRNTMKENAEYLIKEYGISGEEMNAYIEKTLKRHGNTSISDSVFRVGRSPVRKVGYDERLTAPARKLYDMGLPVVFITKAIALAFCFYNPEDEESVEIQDYIKLYGIKEAVKHFTQLQNEELTDIIAKNYEIIRLSK